MTTDPQHLQSLESDLRTQESILEMMKKSCTKEEPAKLRKEWIEPIEKEIRGMNNTK